MTMAPAASADDLVGASGECYNEDYSEGGNAHIAVTSDGEVEHDGIVGDNPADPGIFRAVTTFAQGQVGVLMGEQDDACEAPTDGDDDREGEDYLEVHAGPVQVCYNGDPHVTVDDNECDTRPHGPPQ